MNRKISALLNLIRRTVTEQKKRDSFSERKVLLGDNCQISADCIIGEYTYIGNNSIIEKASIGRYVSIGDNVTIGPGEHRTKWISTSYSIYKKRIGSDYYEGNSKQNGMVTICSDVWIGCNAVVRRGVKIGYGAVIGANAFVNKDIPDFAIAAGVPARVIGERFDENVQTEIRKSLWWNLDIEDARLKVEKLEKKLQIS